MRDVKSLKVSKYRNLKRLSQRSRSSLPKKSLSEKVPLFVGGGDLLILHWTKGMEEDGYGRDLRDCTFCTL